jgi:SMC interacting uncharacterized protein involved in chromosome segregation
MNTKILMAIKDLSKWTKEVVRADEEIDIIKIKIDELAVQMTNAEICRDEAINNVETLLNVLQELRENKEVEAE